MYGLKPPGLAIRSAFLLAIGLFLACTPEGGGGGRDPGQTRLLPPGSPCLVDDECQVGVFCDSERRICVCKSDATCPGPLQCDPFSGRCVEEAVGCSEDADCGAGRWCDVFSRSCRMRRAFCEPCDVPGDCGTGNDCLDDPRGERRFCGAACEADADCPRPGTSCNNKGQCEPGEGATCASLAACTADDLGSCSRDGDCDATQRCDPRRRVCVARRSGCTPGQRCDPGDGACYAPCDADDDGDDDCGVNERCDRRACHGGRACEGRTCVALEPCTVDTDCPQRGVCRLESGTGAGRCVPGCTGNQSCPLGTICALVADRAVCVPGCDVNADCLPDERCEAGTCVAGGRCQTNDACGPCETCAADGLCKPALGPGEDFCAACFASGPDDNCGPGGFCEDGRCAPACPARGCPRGFACEFRNASEGAAFAVCFPQDPICVTECL